MSSIKITALAAALILAGASGLAQASSYAVSYDTISNFKVSFTDMAAGNLSGFTFSTDVAAQGAQYAANFGATNAAAACVGAFCSTFNNSYNAHGTGGDYAYGDALIANTNMLAGTASASSIGEITAGPTGFANGSNNMAGTLFVTTPGTVSFSFNALPYMQVLGTGSASSTMTIAISGLAGQVFSWAPDGVVGSGISGGAETADSLNLNFGIASGTYNPATGSFAAKTNHLAAGAYSVNISMSNQVSAVPEADTWAMLATGLGLVGFAVRRRKQRYA